MSKVYLIKPLEKKSIVYHVEMFRENADGSISWFNLDETYRWGQGFIEEDMDCNLPWEGDMIAYTKADAGWGCEFDDSISIELEFSDDITEEEQEEIRQSYYNGGAGWLFDGEHDWQFEDDYLIIDAPYQVSLCEDDGTVIEENVKLRTRAELEEAARKWREENQSNKWPFSPENAE
jgi:hypothetical protein